MRPLNKLVISILITVLTTFYACTSPKSEEEQTISVDVLPMPNKILKRGGSITLSNNFWVIANVSDSVSSALATYLVNGINDVTGTEAHVTDLYSTRKHQQSVKLVFDNSAVKKSNESYVLNITSSHIIIEASTSQGVYYGMQTFLQLLKSSGTNQKTYVLPKVVIKDSPRYSVRGVLLTTSQLTSTAPVNLFELLGAVKINSIFVDGEQWNEQSLVAIAAKNYLKIHRAEDLPNDVSIISYNIVDENLDGILASKITGEKLDGFVLDLTSTPRQDYLKKLPIIAELSWSNNENQDFYRRIKASRGVNLIK
jgi:Glycosyl hydrolase family 20, domain 2